MSDVIKAIAECIEVAEKVTSMINNHHNTLPITDFRRSINRMLPLISDSDLDFVSIIENKEKILLNNVGMLNPYSFGAIVSILPLCKKYFSDKALHDKTKILESSSKGIKIFISHSTNDVKYVKPFVHLLEKAGINKEKLFCSSVQGYNVPLEKDIYSYILKQFHDYNLYVIYILSQNYYNSPACLNEMGAAWVLKFEYQSILLPCFNFKDVDGAINPMQISFKLDGGGDCKYRLTELKENIFSKLNLTPFAQSHWERMRDEFLEEVSAIGNEV